MKRNKRLCEVRSFSHIITTKKYINNVLVTDSVTFWYWLAFRLWILCHNIDILLGYNIVLKFFPVSPQYLLHVHVGLRINVLMLLGKEIQYSYLQINHLLGDIESHPPAILDNIALAVLPKLHQLQPYASR